MNVSWSPLRFAGSIPQGVTAELVSLLDGGLPVLLYSGQFDIICHHLGTQRMLHELNWKHRDSWRGAVSDVWTLAGAPVAYVKTFKNLQSLVFLNSGHMVRPALETSSYLLASPIHFYLLRETIALGADGPS